MLRSRVVLGGATFLLGVASAAVALSLFREPNEPRSGPTKLGSASQQLGIGPEQFGIPFGAAKAEREEKCRSCSGVLSVHGSFCTIDDKACFDVVRCRGCGAIYLLDSQSAGNAGEVFLRRDGRRAIIGEDGKARTIGEPSTMLDMAAHGRVGVEITVDDLGRIVVLEVFSGLPAAQSGVQVGDQLVTVNETPLAGKSLLEIRELLAIPPGGAVNLAGVRDGQAFRVSLTEVR